MSKETEPSWTIKNLIQECHIMITKLDDFKISHVYPKGIRPANHLENMGVDYVDIRLWTGKENFLIQFWELMRKVAKCIGHSYHINDDGIPNKL